MQLSFRLIKIVEMSFLAMFFGIARANVCPADNTGEQLKKFRDGLIVDVLAGQHGKVKSALISCFPTEVPDCLDDLRIYNQTRSEGVYNNSATYNCSNFIFRGADELPSELHKKSGDEIFIHFPPNIEEIAKKKGWKVVKYKTRSSGGFDGSENLFLVAIPGSKADKRDIYLQISPQRDANPEASRNNPYPAPKDGKIFQGQGILTVITVDRRQWPPIGQLRKLPLDGQANAYRWNDNLGTKECQSCHSVPLRAISPLGFGHVTGEQPLEPEDQAVIREVNGMMNIPDLSWGTCKTSSREIPLGPEPDSFPMGWVPKNSPTRKKEYLSQCVQSAKQVEVRHIGNDWRELVYKMSDKPKINYDNLKKAMNCYECHNGTVRGVIHSSFNNSELDFKVLVDRSMPLGMEDQLSVDERIALLSCLRTEREDLQRAWRASGDWMRKTKCEDVVQNSKGENPSERAKGQ
jgi:hypothetical protein